MCIKIVGFVDVIILLLYTFHNMKIVYQIRKKFLQISGIYKRILYENHEVHKSVVHRVALLIWTRTDMLVDKA